MPSTIVGATSVQQLKENIEAFDIDLDAKVLERIDQVHNDNKDLALTA